MGKFFGFQELTALVPLEDEHEPGNLQSFETTQSAWALPSGNGSLGIHIMGN